MELKSTFLLPTWDCAIPSNINDVDFSLAMKDPPTPAEKPTEVIFPVVRAEIGNVIRNSLFHLEFVNPVLKGIVKVPENGEGKELEILGKELQEKYLKWMNEEIPPHFLTLHSSRHFLAKARLVQYYATFSPSPHFHRHSSTSRQSLPHCTHTDRDLAIHHALTMLKEDTILLSTPSMKPYNWYFQQHFPFAAYVHIIQDMKKRPDRSWVEEAWMVMSENYFARGLFLAWESNPFFKIFARMVCGAWAVCERHRERSKRGEQIECREHNLRFGDEMGEGEGEGGGVKIGERKQRELPKVVKDVQEKLELQEIGLEFGNVSEWLDSGLSQQEMGQQELTNTIQRIESDGNGMTGLNQEFNELDLDLSPMEWIRVLTTGNGV